LPIRRRPFFYGRLFETAPETERCSAATCTFRGQKLMTALATVVNNFGKFDAIVPVVRDLAKRHAAYDVEPKHYALVSAALLWTLEQGLVAEFTRALRTAWTAAYSALSEIMIAAAYPASRQAS
jgi:nitric oxide dioxygenase